MAPCFNRGITDFGPGLHPCAETRKLGTGWLSVSLRPPRGGRKLTQVCFELGRWLVGQGRVQPLTIIDAVDEDADRRAGLLDVAIVAAVDLLLLEGAHEALRLGVVVRIADAAHARRYGVCLQHRRVRPAGV